MFWPGLRDIGVPARQYVFRTATMLEEHGIRDRNIWMIQGLVAQEIMEHSLEIKAGARYQHFRRPPVHSKPSFKSPSIQRAWRAVSTMLQ